MEVTGEATPLDPSWQERVAELLRTARDRVNRGGFPPGHPLNLWKGAMDKLLQQGQTGLMAPPEEPPVGLGTAALPDPEAMSRWGRGDAPYTMGEPGLAGRLPMLKPGRAADAVSIAATAPLGTALNTPGFVGAIRRKGDVMPQKVAAAIQEKLSLPNWTSPNKDIVQDKLAKWLVKSAGEQDPILEGIQPLKLNIREGVREPAGDFLQYVRNPQDRDLAPQRFSEARGLPPAPERSMQEIVDYSIMDNFRWGLGDRPRTKFSSPYTREESAQGAPFGYADDVGMTPENLRKMMEVMPEGSIMARPAQGNPAYLQEQLGDLTRWAADQDPAKLQKMTIPQMFKARNDDMVAALKEFEKTQRGAVEMKFPDSGLEWQRLEPRHLEREGKEMAHCVAGYCKEVERGTKQIYSLRTKDNKSKVTLEVDRVEDPVLGFTNKLTADEHNAINDAWGEVYAALPAARRDYHTAVKMAAKKVMTPARYAEVFENAFKVRQIKGNANSVPAKYAREVQEFLDAKGWDYKDSYDWQRLQDAAQKVEGPEAMRRAIDDPGFQEWWQEDPIAVFNELPEPPPNQLQAVDEANRGLRQQIIDAGPERMAEGMVRAIRHGMLNFNEAVDLFEEFFPGRAGEFLDGVPRGQP